MEPDDRQPFRPDPADDVPHRPGGEVTRRPQALSGFAPDGSSVLAEPSPRRRLAERLAAARKLVRAEYVFYASLAAFAVLAVLAHLYAYFSWDVRATLALQSLPVPGLLPFMRAVSTFGDSWHGWALAALALFAFYARRRRTEMFALLLSVGGGELVNRFVKWLVGRPRPVPALVRVSGHWARESFPSGHVTFYVCLFGFLFFVAYGVLRRGSAARRVCLTLAALPVVSIGASRVYLGAHWMSDVLGAYLLSGLWLALSLHFYQNWKARSTFHQDELKRRTHPPPTDESSGTDDTRRRSHDRRAPPRVCSGCLNARASLTSAAARHQRGRSRVGRRTYRACRRSRRPAAMRRSPASWRDNP
ncbi:MAG: phosphatase PAP2 family protein [Pyrinomonadaceae bacterium]